MARRPFSFALALIIAGAGASLAQAEKLESPITLWQWLGIPQTVHECYDAHVNRHGRHPGLERKGQSPRVMRIADPQNLESDVAVIKTAAEIKRQEDLSLQKIKAVRYLGEIGCGCYDKDGKVTAALLAALDDCTERVRLAAARTIEDGACSEYCEYCKERSCCNVELAKKLEKMAFGQDKNGCWYEPSERVRNAAAAALNACGPIEVEAEPVTPEPEKGEDEGLGPEGDAPEPPVPPTPTARRTAALPSSQRTTLFDPPAVENPIRVDATERVTEPAVRLVRMSPRTGVVDAIDTSSSTIKVRFEGSTAVPQGTRFVVMNENFLGVSQLGPFQVVNSQPGVAILRPVHTETPVYRIAVGDEAVIAR